MYTIQVSFRQAGIAPVVITQVESGQTLLEVMLAHDIELHHNCGGVCSCTTCHIYVDRGQEYIDDKSRREADYLTRARTPEATSRLGCQSLLLEGEGIIEVAIPDQRGLPDEWY